MMRRRLLIGVGLLNLFAAGIGLGMFVQYRLQLGVAEAATRPFLEFARGMSGEGASEPAPPLEHWRYPGATEQGRGRGPSLAINDQTVKPASEHLMFTTPDDYDKVLSFYGSKGGNTSGISGDAITGIRIYLSQADGRDPVTNGPRPVRVQCLRETRASYDVVVFITRAEKEAHTHVILLYTRKVGTPASPP